MNAEQAIDVAKLALAVAEELGMEAEQRDETHRTAQLHETGKMAIPVCDAYAAMLSERPYSVAMRPSRALEELRRSAGSQFDPRVVAAFEQVAAQRGLPVG